MVNEGARVMLRLHYHPTDASMLPHMLLEEIVDPFVLMLCHWTRPI